MDSKEFGMKMDHLKKLVAEKDYATALRIVESIDWNRVKSANLLMLASSVYEENGMLEDAADKLRIAYERSSGGKRILYKLTELSVRSGNIRAAEEYYNEYAVVAPDDPGCLLLQYMILKVKHAPYPQLIRCLELYNEYEPDEKWMYELATTYESAGRVQDAAALCDRIVLMFGSSPYVTKALKLKQKYLKLTDEQRAILYPNSIAGSGLRYGRTDTETAVRVAEREKPVSLADSLAATRLEDEDAVFAAYVRAHELAAEQEEQRTAVTPELWSPEAEPAAALSAAPAAAFAARAAAAQAPAAAVAYASLPEAPSAAPAAPAPLPEVPAVSAAPAVTPAAPAAPAVAPAEAAREVLRSVPEEKVNEGFLTGPEEGSYLDSEYEESSAPAGQSQEPAVRKIGLPPEKDPEGETLLADARIAEAMLHRAEEEQEPAAPRPQARPAFTAPVPESTAPAPAPAAAAASGRSAGGKKQLPGIRLIIEAVEEEEGISIAKKELQAFYAERGSRGSVAKASAEKLNGIGDIGALREKIGDRDLVIVRAGDLKEEAAEQIYTMLTGREKERSIVLVDTPEGLDMLEETRPEIFDVCDILTDEDAREKEYPEPEAEPEAELRPAEPERKREAETRKPAENRQTGTKKAQFRMPERDDEIMEFEDFAQYCVWYAGDKGCQISGKTLLALYERIELLEEEGTRLTKLEAENLVESAADHAEHPGLKGLFRKKYDKEDLLILREEDFIS